MRDSLFVEHDGSSSSITYARRRSGDKRRREILSSCMRRMVERVMVDMAAITKTSKSEAEGKVDSTSTLL